MHVGRWIDRHTSIAIPQTTHDDPFERAANLRKYRYQSTIVQCLARKHRFDGYLLYVCRMLAQIVVVVTRL